MLIIIHTFSSFRGLISLHNLIAIRLIHCLTKEWSGSKFAAETQFAITNFLCLISPELIIFQLIYISVELLTALWSWSRQLLQFSPAISIFPAALHGLRTREHPKCAFSMRLDFWRDSQWLNLAILSRSENYKIFSYNFNFELLSRIEQRGKLSTAGEWMEYETRMGKAMLR